VETWRRVIRWNYQLQVIDMLRQGEFDTVELKEYAVDDFKTHIQKGYRRHRPYASPPQLRRR